MSYTDKTEKQQYAKEYYEKNKEIIKQRAAEHYRANIKKHKELCKLWRDNNYEWQMLKRACDSSKQRKLEFNISIEDIIIPEYCPYLNIKITKLSNKGRQETNASIDRIDNTKGYIKGNIQIISSKANFMKRNASIEELITFAQGVLRTHT